MKLEVGQFYGAGYDDSVGKPTEGNKALLLENKEMDQMDAEAYGAYRSKKAEGAGGS